MADVLLTPGGEDRLAALLRDTHDAERPLSPIQAQVLLDELVEGGDAWPLGAAAPRRVRAVLRASGLGDLAPPGGAHAGIRRIEAARVGSALAAAEGGRALVAGALARAVGAGDAWDGLMGFLGAAGRREGVVVAPWPAAGDASRRPPARRSAARLRGSGAPGADGAGDGRR